MGVDYTTEVFDILGNQVHNNRESIFPIHREEVTERDDRGRMVSFRVHYRKGKEPGNGLL